ncbi:O-antigen ligase family protein [Deinococcus sp. HMF7604]|uniref:O-antigen ligase family protein n=1 Tax=Deinococcus betulae TaxID=2873312 RepID=UPI001CCBA41F|nr:O-antigen ligase family protein [Deinococcus betulae]MBZ9753164.1 O-antigen ligase family protein [Deinococcus betulae]
MSELTRLDLRWWKWWLACLAPFYVISPLALLKISSLKRLPWAGKAILVFYALSQLLPALFSPESLAAVLLAGVRIALMGGLIGLGIFLGSSSRLWPMAIGLVLVYLTALGYSGWNGADVLRARLEHPYMTATTLGFAGTVGVWMAVFLPGPKVWRVVMGVLGILVVLTTGSRGAMLALLFGTVMGVVVGHRKALISQQRNILKFGGAGVALIAAGLLIGNRFGIGALDRLWGWGTTGRDVIWENTLSVIQTAPLTGVGSYRLGNFLAPPDGGCVFWRQVDGVSLGCPAWVEWVGHPWLIAHNAVLQQWAESGPLGVLGLVVLVSFALWSAVLQREVFSVALLSGFVLANITDNTWIVPSSFLAEAFWMVVGMQLLTPARPSWALGLVGSSVVTLLSLPLLWPQLSPPVRLPVSALYWDAPQSVLNHKDYLAIAQLKMAPGSYRVVLSACAASCVTVDNQPFTLMEGEVGYVRLQGDLVDVAEQKVKMSVYRSQGSLSPFPLASRSWTVQVQK